MDAHQLFMDYPTATVSGKLLPELLDNPEESISLDCYVSFDWMEGSWLEDQIFTYVNTDLQERGEVVEPTRLQFFDSPQEKELHDLDFEKRLFKILEQVPVI
jgi:hypothetical protein